MLVMMAGMPQGRGEDEPPYLVSPPPPGSGRMNHFFFFSLFSRTRAVRLV